MLSGEWMGKEFLVFNVEFCVELMVDVVGRYIPNARQEDRKRGREEERERGAEGAEERRRDGKMGGEAGR